MGVMIEVAQESNMNVLLHSAAACCDRDTILQLLQRGADIMAKDSKHCLPLEVAIANKNSKILIC
jgi:ankyrin repeat protein